MNTTQFFEQLEASIARYDLLSHPFYRAWSAGELTRDDLREYARNYYHHVEAFPCYLAELALRLEEGELRRAVLANMCDEKGAASGSGKDSVPLTRNLTPNSGWILPRVWEHDETSAGTSRCRRSTIW